MKLASASAESKFSNRAHLWNGRAQRPASCWMNGPGESEGHLPALRTGGEACAATGRQWRPRPAMSWSREIRSVEIRAGDRLVEWRAGPAQAEPRANPNGRHAPDCARPEAHAETG